MINVLRKKVSLVYSHTVHLLRPLQNWSIDVFMLSQIERLIVRLICYTITPVTPPQYHSCMLLHLMLSTCSLAGSNWVDAINKGLDNSKCLVAVISGAYLRSSYTSSELHLADSNCKPIFPVIFEDVNFEQSEKSLGVKYRICGLRWSFFRAEVDNYVSSLRRLMQGLTRQGKKHEVCLNISVSFCVRVFVVLSVSLSVCLSVL